MKSNIITAIVVALLAAGTVFMLTYKTRKVVVNYVGTLATNEVVVPYNIYVIDGCQYVQIQGAIAHKGNCNNHNTNK